jgi:hypothetical protein
MNFIFHFNFPASSSFCGGLSQKYARFDWPLHCRNPLRLFIHSILSHQLLGCRRIRRLCASYSVNQSEANKSNHGLSNEQNSGHVLWSYLHWTGLCSRKVYRCSSSKLDHLWSCRWTSSSSFHFGNDVSFYESEGCCSGFHH